MCGYMTTREVARTLGISVPRVRQVAAELGIVPHRFGEVLAWSDGDLAAMAARPTKRGPKGPRPRLVAPEEKAPAD